MVIYKNFFHIAKYMKDYLTDDFNNGTIKQRFQTVSQLGNVLNVYQNGN